MNPDRLAEIKARLNQFGRLSNLPVTEQLIVLPVGDVRDLVTALEAAQERVNQLEAQQLEARDWRARLRGLSSGEILEVSEDNLERLAEENTSIVFENSQLLERVQQQEEDIQRLELHVEALANVAYSAQSVDACSNGIYEADLAHARKIGALK